MAKVVNKNNYQYMSTKKMLEKVKTKSLNKLNLYLYTAEGEKEGKYYIGAFAYYNRNNLFLDEVKHAHLIEESKMFEKNFLKKGNGYYDVAIEIKSSLNSHSENNELKSHIIEFVEKSREQHKFSLNSIFNELDITYANGYNFFVKKDVRKLTLEAAQKVQDHIQKVYDN